MSAKPHFAVTFHLKGAPKGGQILAHYGSVTVEVEAGSEDEAQLVANAYVERYMNCESVDPVNDREQEAGRG